MRERSGYICAEIFLHYAKLQKDFKHMKKILIANRGEIALRIMRTARKMGIQTVAVYSDADIEAPHTIFADEAYLLGPPPSDQSYLLLDKIIQIAGASGCDGIHPGYGFLSENAEFASKVTDAGITFIGPSPHSIELMGSKLSAKKTVAEFDVPMIPGTDEAVTDPDLAMVIADKIGYPILIKASAGGGGKGMRVVKSSEVLAEQMALAISEAESSFGDGSVFIEKYITSPRHIEVQVLADNQGNVIHLFERECSIQRRHQKVIEEAPSVILSDEMRNQIGKAAVDVAKSCQYSGAGTVEFILDNEGKFFFLEMNTRLQVEHPVTEYITGIDLVEQQIRVARGDSLSFNQGDLSINGHALELRVYAEDPDNNFSPSIGNLRTYIRPTGQGVRVDDGLRQGMDIPIYYDPMIAKLIVHGKSRNDVIEKMKQAILDYKIEGVKTTLDFGLFVMNHPSFISGDIDTHFIEKHYTVEGQRGELSDVAELAALFATAHQVQEVKKLTVPSHQSDDWRKRILSD